MSVLFDSCTTYYLTPVFNHGDGSPSEMPSVSLIDQQGRIFCVFPSGGYPLDFWMDMMKQMPRMVNHLAMPSFVAINESSAHGAEYQDAFMDHQRKARAFNLVLHAAKPCRAKKRNQIQIKTV